MIVNIFVLRNRVGTQPKTSNDLSQRPETEIENSNNRTPTLETTKVQTPKMNDRYLIIKK